MTRTTLILLCLVVGLLVMACSTTDTKTNTNTTTSGTIDKPAASSTPARPTDPAPSGGGDVGVAECDEYIKKYESCTPKVPEIAREQYKSALAQTRASWKQLAENPQTRSTLAAACKQAAEQQAAAWKLYGCAN